MVLGVGQCVGIVKLEGVAAGLLQSSRLCLQDEAGITKWTQRGPFTDYIVGFSEWYNQCVDVNKAEALFYFLDGLQGDIQAWVRT